MQSRNSRGRATDHQLHREADPARAVEWGKHGITVNAVAPTFIRTPGTEPALSDPEFRADVIQRIAALHRIGEPVEVAGVVVFLASPAATFIWGTVLPVDGGYPVSPVQVAREW